MNWFKFKIELTAWACTTLLATLTALFLLSVFFWPPGAYHTYPVYLRIMGEYGNAGMYVFFSASIPFLWLCRWKALRLLREDRRYTK